MTGVVLCGGQSTRMGTDKGLLVHQSITWAQRAADKLAQLNLPVVLSINEQQQIAYASSFDTALLITDNKDLLIGGPLRGIVSVHLQYPTEDLFVLACDMIDMNKKVLENLYNHYKQNSAEAFVFTYEQTPEPLCAIYTAKGLSKIYKLYQQQQLKKHSMVYALKYLITSYLLVATESKKYFTNYNSPSDFNEGME